MDRRLFFWYVQGLGAQPFFGLSLCLGCCAASLKCTSLGAEGWGLCWGLVRAAAFIPGRPGGFLLVVDAGVSWSSSAAGCGPLVVLQRFRLASLMGAALALKMPASCLSPASVVM